MFVFRLQSSTFLHDSQGCGKVFWFVFCYSNSEFWQVTFILLQFSSEVTLCSRGAGVMSVNPSNTESFVRRLCCNQPSVAGVLEESGVFAVIPQKDETMKRVGVWDRTTRSMLLQSSAGCKCRCDTSSPRPEENKHSDTIRGLVVPQIS